MGLGNIGGYLDENWHGGQMEGDYFDHPEMPLEENGPVKNVSKGNVWNWRHSVTRELMRGRHKFEIMAKYATVLDKFGIRDEVSRFLDKNDGVLGWFIVDVSNFDDKFGYQDIPEEMRACNLYALNATELREIVSRSLVSEGDGTMDGFLGSDDSLSETVGYIDECTGLPCIDGWDGESDDDDARMDAIAGIFLGRNWMTLAEKSRFDGMEGKLPYLVSIVKRHFSPKSTSNGKFEDDVANYGIEGQELSVTPQKAMKDVEVTGVRERTIDDVGYVAMPEKFDIAKENKKSDYKKDVEVGRRVEGVSVDRLRNQKLDGIGIAPVERVDISDNISELKKGDFKDDFEIKEGEQDVEIGELNKERNDEIEFGALSDNDIDVDEFIVKDSIKGEVNFDETAGDLVIDDLDEMKDDEFDFADFKGGDVDVDEMFDIDSDKNEADVDDVPEEVEISNKYDWSW